MALQGQCVHCGIRWTWDRDIRITQAFCPACDRRLNTTTRFSRLRPRHAPNHAITGGRRVRKHWPEFP